VRISDAEPRHARPQTPSQAAAAVLSGPRVRLLRLAGARSLALAQWVGHQGAQRLAPDGAPLRELG
jgi:hypothetical protein